MIYRIVRDNVVVNMIGRNIVRLLLRFSKRAKWLTDRYRVFGQLRLSIDHIEFTVETLGDDFIANDLYYGLPYEKEEFKLIKCLAPSASHFIDVGANTGIFSIFASRVNRAMKVLAFEPHPGNYKRLSRNVSLNQPCSIEMFQLAVGSSTSSLKFTIPADDSLTTIASANEQFTRNFRDIAFKTIDVSQITLDGFLQSYEISTKDLLKIDVEYFEPEVLRGGLKLLAVAQPLVLLEVLNYQSLVQQFPEMAGVIREDHARQIQELMTNCGYFGYGLESGGVRFVKDVSAPGNGRNFLFSPRYLPNQLIPYDQLADTFSTPR